MEQNSSLKNVKILVVKLVTMKIIIFCYVYDMSQNPI
jgi:hypothetical protein